jgi:hypothetical protein
MKGHRASCILRYLPGDFSGRKGEGCNDTDRLLLGKIPVGWEVVIAAMRRPDKPAPTF